ncbi:hypothetical protein BDK51DRAFT_46396 [Blyttiomyces helicus]|uniref:Uncharacterized protein n=1 Tax=Blyttiomyces helicus TaxID=388810 RepID=A0A4P9WL47_9FUNG|nr:hypothetical protein BDK51DRAFT_46396 [Blyttiomyces helicus]|eukprot:RKO93112.1 hypothetical protein BDK51DRAFT_46396 [Blyttiomyces helicus]
MDEWDTNGRRWTNAKCESGGPALLTILHWPEDSSPGPDAPVHDRSSSSPLPCPPTLANANPSRRRTATQPSPPLPPSPEKTPSSFASSCGPQRTRSRTAPLPPPRPSADLVPARLRDALEAPRGSSQDTEPSTHVSLLDDPPLGTYVRSLAIRLWSDENSPAEVALGKVTYLRVPLPEAACPRVESGLITFRSFQLETLQKEDVMASLLKMFPGIDQLARMGFNTTSPILRTLTAHEPLHLAQEQDVCESAFIVYLHKADRNFEPSASPPAHRDGP